MPPTKRLNYTGCPPACLMMSTCDTSGRGPATADGPALPLSGASEEETAAGTGTGTSTSAAGNGVGAKQHCCRMLQGLQDLRNNDTLCDYSLLADGQEIKVHKAAMAACSDYFRVMLTGNMRESRETCVELKGVSALGLKVVVDFVYTGHLALTVENVEEVLSAATHLQVTVAVELCSGYLQKAISVENCVDVLNLAELYYLASMSQRAKQFILHNFEVVADSDQYSKLTARQMASMLAENSLHVNSEFRLFELVLKWIQTDREARQPSVPDLMSHVRLPLLSGEELVEKVSCIPEMKEIPECASLLTEAKDYHIVVSKQPLLQTRRTQVRSDLQSLVMCHAQNLESYTFRNQRQGFLRDATIPLYNPSVVVVDNFMYACGGKYDSTENNEIATARCFRYDPRFDSWFELTSMTEARKDFVVVALEGKLYAVGGQDENMVMCTVERFSIAKNDWEMRASISNSCYGHAGAVCGGRIYISGGQRFSGCSGNVVCYSPQADVWEDRASMTHARCNHVMVEVSGRLYVIGGNIEDSYGFPVPIIAIERYCPAADQWTQCKSNCNIREAGASVVEDKIYIVGGINGEHYYSDLLQTFEPLKDEMRLVEKFPTRIYGRACCILTLPQYM